MIGASTHDLLREIWNQKNIFILMAILEASHYFIYFINEKILKSFANGKGFIPLSNMLEFLFFPSKMFNLTISF